MKAGFALAALLLDDRALAQVASALPPALLPALHAELARAHGEDGEVAALLRVLQPELTPEGVNELPARVRPLLARLLPRPARKTLLADARPCPGSDAPSTGARPDFALDEELLRVLVRLARRPSEVTP